MNTSNNDEMDKVNKRKPIKFWLFALKCRQRFIVSIVLLTILICSVAECNVNNEHVQANNNNNNKTVLSKRQQSIRRIKYEKQYQRQPFNLTLVDNDGLPDETIKSANQTAAVVASTHKSSVMFEQLHNKKTSSTSKDQSTINAPSMLLSNDANREFNQRPQQLESLHSIRKIVFLHAKTSDVKQHFANINKTHIDTITRTSNLNEANPSAVTRNFNRTTSKISVTNSKPKKIHNLFTKKPLLNNDNNRSDGNYLSNVLTNSHVPWNNEQQRLPLENRSKQQIIKSSGVLRPTHEMKYESKQHVFYKKNHVYPPKQRYNCIECQIIPGEPIRKKFHPATVSTQYRYDGMFNVVDKYTEFAVFPILLLFCSRLA